MSARYIVGDVLEVLRALPDASVDLVLSSPPFLALRSYLPADHPDKAKEIGSEPTPGAFIDTLLDVVEECRRVLAPHGSLCFELGDTYAGSGGAGGDYNPGGLREEQPGGWRQANSRRDKQQIFQERQTVGATRQDGNGKVFRGGVRQADHRGNDWPLDKSLCLIPELLRVAMVYGFNPLTGRTTPRWRARNVVRWCRPNPPVGALGDKVRPATSDIVVACVGRKRYFDLDAVRHQSDYDRPNLKGKGSRPGGTPNGQKPNGADHTVNAAGAPPLDHWWVDEETFDQDAWHISTEPYKGSHYACVDEATEALTPEGWLPHHLLGDGDLIAAYDATAGVIRWEPATFHRYPFDGELVAIEKRETSQRLTPNHRVLHRNRNGVEKVSRADELLPSHSLPVAAPFDIGGHGPGENMAALLGWFIAEGCARRQSCDIYQSESANPKHCNRIRDLLDATNATYIETRRVRPVGATMSPRESVEVRWHISGPVARFLLGAAPGKALLPAVVFGWSENECLALLDALIDGDGHTRTSGRRQFIQKDRRTIDMMQALCSRLGFRSTIAERKGGGYNLTIGERRWLSLRGTNGSHEPIRTEHYEGVVWCPSVASTFWLARRNGRPFITGNTWPTDLLVKPILTMCPSRVCTTCGVPSERITGDVEYVPSATNRGGSLLAGSKRVAEGVNQWVGKEGASASLIRSAPTTGWTDCGHETWRKGVVLDPFGGSGTTAVVALGHGRDAILIDLDERNAHLARDRVGMWLEIEHHSEVQT